MSASENRLHIERLENKFRNYKMITVDDFCEFYNDVFGEVSKNTVRWYIYELKKKKIITNITRGHYILSSQYDATSTEYFVVTMDIINSSKIEYSEFNSMLAHKISLINTLLNEKYEIDRKYHVSQGDEIQILIPTKENIGDILLITLSFLYPLLARYGVSIGMIQDEIKENSWDMNGPLFWNARDQLEKLKNKKSYEGLIKSGFNETDRICNNILPLINRSISKITEKQWHAIREEFCKSELEHMLENLQISKTSYYERLEVSNIIEIKAAFKAVQELLNRRREIN